MCANSDVSKTIPPISPIQTDQKGKLFFWIIYSEGTRLEKILQPLMKSKLTFPLKQFPPNPHMRGNSSPANVHQTYQNRPGRFNLSAGMDKLVPIASYNEREKADNIVLCYEQPVTGMQYKNQIPIDKVWILKIGLYGGSTATFEEFKLYINDEGFLKLDV